MTTRTQIQIKGIVQGVGFRPFVFALAEENKLKGRVLNNESGVFLDIEGSTNGIERLIDELQRNPPPLSIVESVTRRDVSRAAEFQDFQILTSRSNDARFVPIPADIGVCEDCLAELFDPHNRRYRYPFINCTNCGPRFTIIENVPYDREYTTMRDFRMCAACRTEYEDPLDRRFHAEATCCADCGPKLFLSGVETLMTGDAPHDVGNRAISRARQLLQDGKILAVKGIGGYHLACDAGNTFAVEKLRRRKYREDKPFALMADSIAIVEKWCHVLDGEKTLLHSPERPIVLLEKRSGAQFPDAIAPKVKSLGFMLPYAPLHHLLVDGLERPLVLTSANLSDEPICYEDEDAKEKLSSIADYFLSHNRRIHIRTDDSVGRVSPCAGISFIRRARGYAPRPVKTIFKFNKQIIACGAELKNTFCLTKDRYAFLSHHVGDLENLETLRSFANGIEHYKRLFNLQPEIVAYDLHPEYLSTKYALELEVQKIGVQQHHAHIASCLADNDAEGEVIGVAFDGTGFGSDGRLWGGEVFVADFREAERVAHLEYMPMPGGAKAIKEPWRMAAVYLQRAFGDEFTDLELPFVQNLDHAAWTTIRRMIETETNCPETSSMGRLFDAVAGLIGLRNAVNYEGQAAIELEAIANGDSNDFYEFEFDAKTNLIRTENVIRRIVEDLFNKVPPASISVQFHNGVAQMIAAVAQRIRSERKINRVALSGGVFQNMLLLENARRLLRNDGFEVLVHSRVPANDGGIALGQAAVANALIEAGKF